VFLIIFRYLGEAILELGRQYSIEKSRHIISMSFPRQQSQWVNIWGPEWHFCKSEWQSGNFVNNEWKSEMTTRIRSHFMHQPHHIIFYLSPSFHGVAPCGFSRFWLIFTVFMHIWQHPLRVLRFEFVFLLGQLVLWFHWLWTIPIHGVFTFIYHSTVLHSIGALKSLFLVLICVFRIRKLGILVLFLWFQNCGV